jgi:formate hydrogenlyase transcriptional activator
LECPSGYTLTNRKPAVLREEDLKRMAECSEMAQRMVDKGVKSFCAVPLVAHDKQLGALNAGRYCDTVFTDDEVELLSQVAQQVAIAVENGLAYKKIDELKEKLSTEKLYLEEEIRTNYNFEEIIGDSPAIRETLQKIVIVSPTDSTVLIQGETGTGKELVARAIHNLSGRKARTFVKINCAAIPTGLLESELFGHEKGAFTGALARQIGRFELSDGSTMFLDEIGDLPLETQVKLLRVLETREFERLGGARTLRVNARIIAATHRNLEQKVAEGTFREDLYYRLNVFPIAVPPLREREDDVTLLVKRFVSEFAQAFGKRIDLVDEDSMAALRQYAWPGNVRELKNVVQRAIITTTGHRLVIPTPRTVVPAATRSARLSDVERDHIRTVLESTGWRVRGSAGAADRLGLKPTTLETRMAKLGLKRPSPA